MAGVVALAAIVHLATASAASAQLTSAQVYGTIHDAQGAAIPGATLVLVSESRGTKSAPVVTSQTGDFVFPTITPGTYTIEASMSGFKTVRRPGIQVSAGDRIAVPTIVLEVGGQTETVNVAAESPTIQAQSGERSFTITTEQVQNLPLQSRSFFNLALMAPGVVGRNGATATNISRLGGGGSTNFQMDGIGITDTGSNTIQLQMNVDAIAEVKVMTGSFQAEYGRASGMQIAAVTKSGTNRFRGSVYDVTRNSDWNSNSWANRQNGNPKNVVKESDWGYTLGGPVGKPGGANKLFFFFAQEWRPRETAGSIARFRVPTLAERQGDFSQSRDNNGNIYNLIRDASTGLPCTATNTTGCFADGGVLGKVPQSKLNQIGLSVLNFYPLPTNTGQETNIFNAINVASQVKQHQRQDTYRGDYQVSQSLRLSGKMIAQNNSKESNGPFTQSRFGVANNALFNGFNDMVDWVPLMTQVSGTATYSLNQSTFLEGSYGYFLNDIATTAITPASNINNTPGLNQIPMLFPNAGYLDPSFYAYRKLTSLGPDAAPFFRNGVFQIPPSFSFGTRGGNNPGITPRGCCFTENLVHNVNVSVTKLKGRHTAKAGMFYEYAYKPQDPNTNYRGSLNFGESATNPLDTTFGFANAALGIFQSYQQASRYVEGKYVYTNLEFFLQDNWKMNSRLTLDYGMRFVHMSPQYDANGFYAQFFSAEFNPANAAVLFKPVCAAGAVAPCTGNNQRALNPATGEVLGPGSNTAVGSLVPGVGNRENGLVPAGTGNNPKENYKWPALLLAPRFGAAYDLSGNQRLIIRGGGGLYYDRTDGNQIFPMSVNPHSVQTITVPNNTFAQLSNNPLLLESPSGLTVFQFESKIPTSSQWNVGMQMAVPWSSTIDVEYVGNYTYNQLLSVNINSVPLDSAYQAQNQDPTKAQNPATPGSAAYDQNFLRPLQGYGGITRRTNFGNNTYHSLQTSWNRRFRNNLQFTLNYTLGRNVGLNGGTYFTVDKNDNITLLPENRTANYGITGNDRTHTVKGNFVWDLPDMHRSNNQTVNVISYVVNDWQLSGVFTGGSGAPYTPGFSIPGINNQILTGSPDYGARVIMTGDPGKGCSSDYQKQFATNVFMAPTTNSDGLESGQNFMRGCPDHVWDFAVARNIRLGGARSLQIRVEMFNAFNEVIITGRNASAQFVSLQDRTTITNLPGVDANGNPVRTLPSNAGFGVATSAQDLRSFQLQLRFSF
jgi:hypothetical protein